MIHNAELESGVRRHGSRSATTAPTVHAAGGGTVPGVARPWPTTPDPSAARELGLPRLATLARGSAPGWPVAFVTLGVQALASQEPQATAVSYGFDADPDGEPYQVDVRFIGVRLDVKGNRGPQDSFQVSATLPRVLPGSGKTALTQRVLGKSPGADRSPPARPQHHHSPTTVALLVRGTCRAPPAPARRPLPPWQRCARREWSWEPGRRWSAPGCSPP